MNDAYNPRATDSLAHSIVTLMMEMDEVPLDDVPRFSGAGVYAIYYVGRFHAYRWLGKMNKERATVPIYVGKAVPSGRRQGIDGAGTSATCALADRVRQHATSVRAAQNLDIADFRARWLVIEDIWTPLAESALIREYRPVWNVIVDGFGDHDPGQGLIDGFRSRWDTIHPGRPWADKYPARPETSSQIDQEITEYLRSRLA